MQILLQRGNILTPIHVAVSLFTERAATLMGLMSRKRNLQRTSRRFFGQRSRIKVLVVE
jgi:hypothetical protein